MAIKIQNTSNTTTAKHNLAVIGPSKSGKTYLLSTLPGKVLICNTDKGIVSLSKFKIQSSKVESWDEFVEFMQFITNATKMKKHGYDWIAFDSASIIAEYLKEDLKKRGVTGFDFWNEYREKLGGLFQTTRDTEIFNSITSFEETEKENSDGLMEKRFGIEGSLCNKVPYFFDASFATKKITKKDKEDEYVLQFCDKNGYSGLGGRASFNNFEPANINHIINKLKKG